MTLTLLGTGLMGAPMARRLRECGHRLIVWNRSPEKAQALVETGAEVAQSVSVALQEAQTVLLMLADYPAIKAVLAQTKPEDWHGRTLLQMSTIAPEESRLLAAQCENWGAHYLECPVLGSQPEAGSGKLILISAGPTDILTAQRPLLNDLGQSLHYLGPEIGQAAAAKLALNQLIPSLIAMFGLSLHYIQAQGLDPEAWMGILRESSLYAPSFDKKRERLLNGHFSQPNFPVKHMIKDLALFSQSAGDLDTRQLDAVSALLHKAVAAGLAEADYAAVGHMVLPEAHHVTP
ncbi:MAG: NAD(P)-dependent oxidoreductase [Candidatus Sericytochromatia bacterium]